MINSVLSLSALVVAAQAIQYQSVYTINNLPVTSEEGQSGYNNCGTIDSQTSMCQTVHINSLEDFCLWAPPSPNSSIGDTERIETAWCTKTGHGARLIPQDTITGAHYLETPQYIQITGQGNMANLNIAVGDGGGELDPHGADGNGNPIGGLVFSSSYGVNQVAEWTSFIGTGEFCFRICKPSDSAYLWCQHIYDLQGCYWNEPGNYGTGFDTCAGDTTVTPPGIYVNGNSSSTFQQGDGSTPAPPAHAAGASSMCTSNSAPGVAASDIKTVSLTIPTTVATISSSSGSASTTRLLPTLSSASASSSLPFGFSSLPSVASITSTPSQARISTAIVTRTSSASVAPASASTSSAAKMVRGSVGLISFLGALVGVMV